MPKLLTTMVMDVDAPTREAAMEEARDALRGLKSTDDASARLLAALSAAIDGAVEPTGETDREGATDLASQILSARDKAREWYRTAFPCVEEPLTDAQITEDAARLVLAVSLVGDEFDVSVWREPVDEPECIMEIDAFHETPEEALEAFEEELMER